MSKKSQNRRLKSPDVSEAELKRQGAILFEIEVMDFIDTTVKPQVAQSQGGNHEIEYVAADMTTFDQRTLDKVLKYSDLETNDPHNKEIYSANPEEQELAAKIVAKVNGESMEMDGLRLIYVKNNPHARIPVTVWIDEDQKITVQTPCVLHIEATKVNSITKCKTKIVQILSHLISLPYLLEEVFPGHMHHFYIGLPAPGILNYCSILVLNSGKKDCYDNFNAVAPLITDHIKSLFNLSKDIMESKRVLSIVKSENELNKGIEKRIGSDLIIQQTYRKANLSLYNIMEHFGKIEDRLDEQQDQLDLNKLAQDEMNLRMGNVEVRMGNMEVRMGNVDGRLKLIEANQRIIAHNQVAMNQGLNLMAKNISSLTRIVKRVFRW